MPGSDCNFPALNTRTLLGTLKLFHRGLLARGNWGEGRYGIGFRSETEFRSIIAMPFPVAVIATKRLSRLFEMSARKFGESRMGSETRSRNAPVYPSNTSMN